MTDWIGELCFDLFFVEEDGSFALVDLLLKFPMGNVDDFVVVGKCFVNCLDFLLFFTCQQLLIFLLLMIVLVDLINEFKPLIDWFNIMFNETALGMSLDWT